jgi:REP element-mobilizing transposase RayT
MNLIMKFLHGDNPDSYAFTIRCKSKNSSYSVVSKIKGYKSKQLRSEFPELKKRLPILLTLSKFISTIIM